jgi:cysteine desulfurase
MMRLPIYLDYQATTPVDSRVLEEMLPFFSENFGNAASIDHEFGYNGLKAVNIAREKIAIAIGAKNSDEIIFTSGATESDNLAIIGVAEKYESKGKHLITSVTEHKAILDTCKHLENRGWEVTYLAVDSLGHINLSELERSIRPDTIMVSIMAANNEIGTIAPIQEIGQICHSKDCLFHTDATQAIGYIPINVSKMNIDLLSFSGHKIYGPKGIGGLYVRNISPRVKLVEQIHGGGHERGMRSGTLNVPGIVGLGKAIEISQMELETNSEYLRKLRDFLWNEINTQLPNAELNGDPIERLPHNLNIYLPEIEAKSLIVRVKNKIAISAGSACTTTKVEPSHVIMALGYNETRAHQSIRIGVGRKTSMEDLNFAARALIDVANSPL